MPLNHTHLSKFDIFEAPLTDKDELKRVILFSDVPTDDSTNSNVVGKSGPETAGAFSSLGAKRFSNVAKSTFSSFTGGESKTNHGFDQ